MRAIDEKGTSRNPKIGRPSRAEKGSEFRKQYLISETKFQIECELLVTIHEMYFEETPLDPQNRRVEISYITTLFQKYNCLEAYETLLKLNQFYYKNSSVFPEDKLKYTSLIDIGYMAKQLRLNLGEKIRAIELVLTVVFYLYNQKLINFRFFCFLENRVEIIAKHLIAPQIEFKKDEHRIELLIIALILEISVKEQILIKR